jgi:hypothetical protein
MKCKVYLKKLDNKKLIKELIGIKGIFKEGFSINLTIGSIILIIGLPKTLLFYFEDEEKKYIGQAEIYIGDIISHKQVKKELIDSKYKVNFLKNLKKKIIKIKKKI